VTLRIEESPIPGLLVVRLDVKEDARGWFKENWQRDKLSAVGLPDLGPVQHNVAFNVRRGTTRGVHAEPWDKYVSLASGRAFGAWVDLREGDSFGSTFWIDLDPTVAVFVPRGVGNSYQTLEDATSYTYLVNQHWRPDAEYLALDLADRTAAIPWPVPLAEAEVSDKDRSNPPLVAVAPMRPKKVLVIGANGQLGRALRHDFPDAEFVSVDQLDITDGDRVATWPWHEYAVVINAAAYTAVDDAEAPEGRVASWGTNAQGPATLARLATEHGFTLAHYSSDYVFDGTGEELSESDPYSPLGVYGQSKAAGDLAVATAPRHYLIRTSWLVGDGPNFVRTMASLAARGASPSVVDDQTGRLTFTSELSRATRHLIESGASYGTYNVSNSGPATTWADVAKAVFRHCGRDEDDVRPVSTAEYAAGKQQAPRPRKSVLSLAKLEATGFRPEPAGDALARYLATATATAEEHKREVGKC